LQDGCLDAVGPDAVIAVDMDNIHISGMKPRPGHTAGSREEVIGRNTVEVTVREIAKKDCNRSLALRRERCGPGIPGASPRTGHVFPVHVTDSPLWMTTDYYRNHRCKPTTSVNRSVLMKSCGKTNRTCLRAHELLEAVTKEQT